MPENLTLDRVSKRYGQGPYVIKDLNRTFNPGTATALVGPNGSGKTTLLRMLSALSFPTSGKITYGDLDVADHPYRYLSHVAIVHDSPDLPEYLTAVELLEYAMRARGRWDETKRDRISGLLDDVLLDERRENLIGTYSSGMLRKTQIALALALEPDVLLMDEPFRGLDEPSTEAAVSLLHSFKGTGGILVISSHLRGTLEAVCDDFLYFGTNGQKRKQAS